MVDFATEQHALASACWHLVGVREQLAVPNAWLRRTVFGHDVFIQNFAGELRGYSNICAHRGFPIRTTDAGTGPVQCGFHGWVYSRDGVPTGIPRNTELFGLSRDAQRELALAPVRIETIGRFVFAAVAPTVPPLAEYLGRHGDVYRTIDADVAPLMDHQVVMIGANWKRHVEITLDDYHLASVHPTTFGGAANNALHGYVYEREGLHSNFLWRRDADWSFAPFWEGVRHGINERGGYKILNSFPSSILASTRGGAFASVATPIDAGRTRLDYFLWAWHDHRHTADEIRESIEFNLKVVLEDRDACEMWATSFERFARPAVLGKLEQRVGWFRESYARVIGA